MYESRDSNSYYQGADLDFDAARAEWDRGQDQSVGEAAPERADAPEQIARRWRGKAHGVDARKGKTYEQMHGESKAAQIKEKLRAAMVGREPPAPRRGPYTEEEKALRFGAEYRRKQSEAHRGYKASPETRAKQSAARKGRKQSKEAIEKTAAAARGRKRSAESRAKQGLARRKNTGRYGSGWQWYEWAAAVKTRDGNRCQRCGRDSVRMFAHHIVPWGESVAARFDVSNGVALCGSCHLKTHREMKEQAREAV